MQVSFKSTYQIPLVEQNITPSKREALKKMVNGYQNVLYPKGNIGNVRVSIRKRLDQGFEQKLRQIGFKVYKKFDRHNVPKTFVRDGDVYKSKMDIYINDELNNPNSTYKQFGKQKKARR